MPENKDISYQPNPSGYVFSKPKIGFLNKILHSITINKYLLTVICLFLLFQIGVLNYLNFLPLSNFLPELFGNLPHKYNTVATQKALANVAYSSDYNGFYLQGKLVAIGNDTVTIEYNKKVAEFLLSQNLKCQKTIVPKSTDGFQKQFDNVIVFCDQILKIQNIGKRVNIVYEKIPQGFFVLNNIILEINN